MVTVTIEKLNHEGRGIAHLEGKTIFVEGALPQETVKIRYIRRHHRFDEAALEEIITPAPFRVTPFCPHFSVCGGCRLQHIAAEQQIALKQQTLQEQLAHFGRLQPQQWLTPLQGPSWNYRDKARLSAKYVHKKQKFLLGFHERSGRFVADIEQCPILHRKAAELLPLLRQQLSVLSIFQHIPQVEMAAGEKNTLALIIRHLKPFSEEDKQALISFAQQHTVSIYLHPNKPETIYCLWCSTPTEKLTYTLQPHTLTFNFYPTQFTQINATINQQMVTQALALLQPTTDEILLDLFCGIGNFTLPLAKACKKIIGIESDEVAVTQAKENAQHNHIQNAFFYAHNLYTPDTQWPWMNQSYDKILLDPPRSGAIEILPFVTQWQAKKILYVSCNPATLARDAGELVHRYGYTLTHAGVMDMFPHTRHVESMALFEKEK